MLKMPNLAVTYTDFTLLAAATQLAAQLHLPLLAASNDPAATDYAFLLLLTPTCLGIQNPHDKKVMPFSIDFVSGKMQYRSNQAGLRNELIARAIGKHPRDNPRILDATAGLGRDSFILATLGFHVTLLERSPILHALLQDALQRAANHPEFAQTISRMQLHHADALTWLPNQSFDVIYLDPMFPERKKSASIKKEMAILQDLLGKDLDCADLLELALTCATQRVVVKRPRLAATITDRKPNFALTGKSSRFDVYLTPKG